MKQKSVHSLSVLALAFAGFAGACSDGKSVSDVSTLTPTRKDSTPATTPAVPPVTPPPTPTPTPAPTSRYAIETRYVVPATPRQQQAVAAAVARWQTVITSELANIPVQAPKASCFPEQPALNETVDDILIFIEFVDIDGAGNVLGQAGPCYIRSDNSLPVIGHLKLDASDLAMMERNGTIDDVVLHEIGHILGIGTLWPDKSLLQGAGTIDPRFTGNWALTAYRTLGGVDAFIPVENTGAEGTKDGHWRESIFGNELMTGYISAANNPMSAMTIASLSDLGYGTNAGAANSFTLNARSGGIVADGIDLHKKERVVRPKFKIDRSGRKMKIDL